MTSEKGISSPTPIPLHSRTPVQNMALLSWVPMIFIASIVLNRFSSAAKKFERFLSPIRRRGRVNPACPGFSRKPDSRVQDFEVKPLFGKIVLSSAPQTKYGNIPIIPQIAPKRPVISAAPCSEIQHVFMPLIQNAIGTTGTPLLYSRAATDRSFQIVHLTKPYELTERIAKFREAIRHREAS